MELESVKKSSVIDTSKLDNELNDVKKYLLPCRDRNDKFRVSSTNIYLEYSDHLDISDFRKWFIHKFAYMYTVNKLFYIHIAHMLDKDDKYTSVLVRFQLIFTTCDEEVFDYNHEGKNKIPMIRHISTDRQFYISVIYHKRNSYSIKKNNPYRYVT